MSKELKWHKIAEHEAEIGFPSNNIAVVEVNGKRFCVARHQGKLFAFALKCPHASGLLAEGRIDAAGHVVCPIHQYRFDPANGRNISGEGYYLKHWPVEQRTEGIFVGMEETGLFNWL